MGTGGNQVPILTESIPSFKAFDEYNFSVDSKVKTLEARDFKGGAIVFRQDAKQTMESIPSEAYTIPHDERSMCCQPGMSDTLTHYVHYVAYSMGHDERSSQFEENKTDPLTASDYKQPPVVAQPMSTTGGAECVCDRQRTDGTIEDAGHGGNIELYARSNRYHAETCNGRQVAGSLCAHDGRGFNGQDVANDKLIIEHYETDNDS